jgi:response regulator RpfG family c-di-GMP phosphodiesterase
VETVSRGAQPEQTAKIRGIAILDRLVAEGRVSPSLYDEVLIHAQRTQSTAEESILQLGLLSEAELLKYIAGLFKTRFVGSEKLAKAGIDPWLLGKIPKKLAKRLTAFPILYDARTRTLSVVAADVSDDDVRQQMQFATGARDVKVYVAREAAIRAAIAKHYDQNDGPFDMLLSGASSRTVQSARESDPVPGWGQVFEEHDGQLVRQKRAVSLEMEQAANNQGLEPESEQPPPQTHARAAATQSGALIEQLSAPSEGDDLDVSPEVYLETLSVLVTLIEQLSQDRGGHAMRVAQVCKQLGQRIRLTLPQVQAILVAAYLHDLGVSARSHVTPFDVAHDESKRDLARRVYAAPSRLLESVALPTTAVGALRHRFERFDGSGFPERSSGKNIPLGARVLAVAESYVDLTQNKANVLGRRLAPEDACDALDKHKGTAFDPAVVDWLRHIVTGDGVKMLSPRHRVLIVDPDPEETAVLEVQFTAQGYEVVIERSAAGALRAAQDEKYDVIVSEVRLTDGDGFDLLRRLRQTAHGSVPFMFLAAERAQASVNRGLELGASDYVVKPASAAVVVAKAGRILGDTPPKKTGARGVSGSLQEMSLPDVIQILANGRKSGRLQVSSGSLEGEMMFQDGSIHDATFGDLRGADAVYGILRLTEGDFALVPDDTPLEDAIGIPTHHLLLEAMRRLDEEQR